MAKAPVVVPAAPRSEFELNSDFAWHQWQLARQADDQDSANIWERRYRLAKAVGE